jgi:hypothetical protein
MIRIKTIEHNKKRNSRENINKDKMVNTSVISDW